MDNPPLYFCQVYNRMKNRYWDPIEPKLFEEGVNNPIVNVAKEIAEIIEKESFEGLPPMIIGIIEDRIVEEKYFKEQEVYQYLVSDQAKACTVNLSCSQNSHPINISPLRRIAFTYDEEISYEYGPFPLLIIGWDDLMKEEPEGKDRFNYRHRFWDSSIWYRFIPQSPFIKDSSFKERLKHTLQEISFYNALGLYNTAAAQEYLELQTRLQINSYLINYGSDHSERIVPNRFHSETLYREGMLQLYKNLKDLEWGAIVIDDYCYEPITSRDKSIDGKKVSKPTKLEILNDLMTKFPPLLQENGNKEGEVLTSILTIYNSEKDSQAQVEDWVDEAISLLGRYPYTDIILLDFWLGEKSPSGVELIEELTCQHFFDSKPFDKHWIFPMSSFGFAFNDLLPNRVDMNRTLELSEGGDPISTPNKFLYQLFTFLSQQKKFLDLEMNDIIGKTKSLVKTHQNPKAQYSTLYSKMVESASNINSLINQNKGESQFIDNSFPRNTYPRLSKRISNHISLKNSVPESGIGSLKNKGQKFSAFAVSYFENSGRANLPLFKFCIHLQELFHLLAFESAYEWSKMYDEYKLTKNFLEELNAYERQKIKNKRSESLTQSRNVSPEELESCKNILELAKSYIIAQKKRLS